MDNSPLAFHFMTATLKAINDQDINRFNFKTNWKNNPASFGTLSNARAEAHTRQAAVL
jgi:hypothetical protein